MRVMPVLFHYSRVMFFLSLLLQSYSGCSNAQPKQSAHIAGKTPTATITGKSAMSDWRTDKPGLRRIITSEDLPPPYATNSVDNGPRIVGRPADALPVVPKGFTVNIFAEGLQNPRKIITSPNGDIFIAESDPGRIRLLRDETEAGHATTNSIFAAGLDKPFGLAFYPPGPNPQYLYVGNTGAVVRYSYRNGDLTARGAAEVVVPDIPGGGRLRGGGHWTRDVVFSKNAKRMYVSVGSVTNVFEGERGNEERRADILSYNPDGSAYQLYASGIRNAVGLAIHPITGDLWASVNERDGLGDDLPPDYITRVKAGGFYGWPWYYIGPNEEPRHAGKHPELKTKVIIPDLLIQAHSASLCMTFYTGKTFPLEYRYEGFAAEHGSWNRLKRTGYKVIRVPLKNGIPSGEYEDFMTGFVTEDGNVWGRPVGITTAKDGALLVSDDGSGTIWRIQHK